MIDRTKAKKVFAEYVSNYDMNVGQNQLKVKHTYKVADISEQIAIDLKLSPQYVDLAWLIGLLHDIARFEQNKRYGTFNDLVSIDHGELGADILFLDGKIRDFTDVEDYDYIIEKAIRFHNKYRVDASLDDRTKMFCNIIRDADKLDIFRVNLESSKEDVYEVSEEIFKNSQFSQAIFESFFDEKVVLKQLKRNGVDGLACHLSLVYELVYPISIKIAMEQGYVEKMMNYKTENKVAENQLKLMSEKLIDYISQRLEKQNILELK
ncbi:MAG: HD domain-containing protein [Clostridia bacterium]|nr:HD domain-containing protein [Clostridia bacterium]